MTHRIIKTENYLLIIDDSKIELGNWHTCVNLQYPLEVRFVDESTKYDLCKSCKNIIAHLPFNNAPTLEGIDLLPPLEPIGFDEYQYTEEDIHKIREMLVQGALTNMSCSSAVIELDKIIQQLKMPIGFSLEAKDTHIQNGVLVKSQWVGEYIY
jgi:hypothetical protein